VYTFRFVHKLGKMLNFSTDLQGLAGQESNLPKPLLVSSHAASVEYC
jgi:hypothetical protein